MSKSREKKTQQLGEDPSKAAGRLVKDILFDFVEKSGHLCFRCGKKMTRDNFSIDHKEDWLDSIDPVTLFFSLDNIAYSHHSCNVGAAKHLNKKACGHYQSYRRGCRCDLCKLAARDEKQRYYSPERRRKQWLENGT